MFALLAMGASAQLPDQSLPTGSLAEISAFLATNEYHPVRATSIP
jgi:hypothetical protein